MRTTKIGTTLTVAAWLSLGIAGCAANCPCTKKEPVPAAAAAPAAPVSGTVGENVVTATAVVKTLDQKTRMVTLQRTDGSLIKFRAGDEVRNLPQVEVGDEVKVTFYEALAYEVRKPGEGVPGASVAEQAARAELGQKPGGMAARVTTVTATITAIDKAATTVTLRGPDGESTTVKARDPQKLDRVSVGDLVDITYTEAIGIAVETPKK